MTDNEIIKALECCIKAETRNDCEQLKCPACNDIGCHFCNNADDDFVEVTREACKQILSLIKSQKAEIERLQQKYELSEAEREANVKGFTETLETVRTETIKEFAERLKSTMFNEDFLLCEPCDMANIIDNLVKEMTEDEGK